MEIHQLQYVLGLAKHLKFSLASEELNVSQPTLSYGIKTLEKELGINLFTRNTRSVKLTTAGEEFVVHAKRVLAEIENAKNAMTAHTNMSKGHIKIGAIPIISYLGITPIIADFQKAYPGINMEIHEEDTSVILKKMYSSELDAAFINSTHLSNTDLDIYPLIHDKMVLYLAKTHRLAKNRKTVTLEELADENFFMVSGLKNDFVRHCQLAGFEPNINLVSIQALTVKNLVENGLGIAPFTSRIARSFLSHDTSIINFTPVIKRTTALAIAKTNNLRITRVFRDFVLKHYTL